MRTCAITDQSQAKSLRVMQHSIKRLNSHGMKPLKHRAGNGDQWSPGFFQLAAWPNSAILKDNGFFLNANAIKQLARRGQALGPGENEVSSKWPGLNIQLQPAACFLYYSWLPAINVLMFYHWHNCLLQYNITRCY